MASRTLVNGTGYDIKNGRTLVNGTGYSIKKGRTLVDGTGYDILLNRYQLAPWTGSDGDKHVTVQSRWWSEIRKGLTVQHTLSATVSGNTDEKAQSGFRLTGLQAGDTVELTYCARLRRAAAFILILSRKRTTQKVHSRYQRRRLLRERQAVRRSEKECCFISPPGDTTRAHIRLRFIFIL